jgi:Methyltransferase domain
VLAATIAVEVPRIIPAHFERMLYRTLGLDPERNKILHHCLAEHGDTCYLNARTSPTFVADAHDLRFIPDNTYDCVVLDPPYSDEESKFIYSIDMKVRRADYLREAVRVLRARGYLVDYHVRQQPRRDGCGLVRRTAVCTRAEDSLRAVMVYRKQ